MAFDGIVTQAITHELKNDLIGGKIDKIHQPDKNTILLGIYSNSIHYALNICIDAHNCRINLTTNSKENPLVAPNFCMLLRKHLISGKISTIEMYGLERLVKINIETINEFNEIEIKSLIIELMGKHSNIILINDKNIIIDSLRHIWATDTIYRDILPSRTYSFPTSEKLDYTKISDIYSIFQDNLNLSVEEFSKLFANTFNGFSLSFIKSALEKCNITTINKENLLKLQKYINNILTFPNNLYFTEVYKNNKLSDFTLSLGNNITVEKFYLNKFIDNFYFSRETEETFNNCKNNALKLTTDSQKKLLNRLNSINTKLKDCEERDKYRLYGELITSNLYKLTNTHTDYIELDVQLTSDGEVIVMHDSNAYRTTGVDENIVNMTYKEVRRLDAGSWYSDEYKGEKVPGLREVLELAQGKIKLNIELKPADNGEELARKTVALIEKYNMENDCVITSFSSSALSAAKSCDENIRVGYILSAAYGDYYDMKNIDFFSVNAAFLSKRTIDAIHNSGKQVYAWTVNNKDSIKNLTNKGVDGVITDNPVLARETIYSRDTSETIVNMIRYVFNQ